MEAQAEMYRRPFSFPSQDELYNWLGNNPPAKTSQVSTIVLKLTDIDLSPLVSSSSKRNPNADSAWSLYQKDLERLDRALSQLPSLKTLTVIPPTAPSTLLRGLYTSFLDLIHRRCPDLRELALEDDRQVLASAPKLASIAKVTFTRDGYEITSGSSTGSRGPRSMAQDYYPNPSKQGMQEPVVVDPQLLSRGSKAAPKSRSRTAR